MKTVVQAVVVIVVGAVISWFALVVPAVLRYDPGNFNE